MLRNESCEIIMAESKKENGVNDSMEVELLAILKGLQICILIGIYELIIESDSLFIVNELLEIGESRSLRGNIVYDARIMMKMLPRCSIQYKRQLANKVAHTLTKSTLYLDDLVI